MAVERRWSLLGRYVFFCLHLCGTERERVLSAAQNTWTKRKKVSKHSIWLSFSFSPSSALELASVVSPSSALSPSPSFLDRQTGGAELSKKGEYVQTINLRLLLPLKRLVVVGFLLLGLLWGQ